MKKGLDALKQIIDMLKIISNTIAIPKEPFLYEIETTHSFRDSKRFLKVTIYVPIQ